MLPAGSTPFLWYQRAVCRLRLGIALLTSCALTACGQPAATAPMPTDATSAEKALVNPANISRARAGLPAGYEVADITGPASPAAFWGLRPGWMTDPPQCDVLAAPPTDETTTRGWSGSGPGGIVHAVVTGSRTVPVVLDQTVLTGCSQWTVASGNTTGTVELTDAPPVHGATTIGMKTIGKTVVEGGTETATVAYTFSAYLDDYLAFVTVVTDPGTPNPALDQQFAADLMVKTVTALRG